MSHVALLIPTVGRIGGAERQVLLLARGLARRNWRVTLVALSGDEGGAAQSFADSGVGYMSLHMRKGLADPRGWWRFQRWLRDARPDVIHAHLPHAAWFARWSSLIAPQAVLVDTIHTSATGTLGRRLGYKISKHLPDCVTTVSSAVAEAYMAGQMVLSSPERLRVVPNGIDAAFWRPDSETRAVARRELKMGDAFVWLAAGRMEPVKDYATLLRGFAGLRESALLLIAGTGAQQAAMQQIAMELGIEARVRFLGFQSDLRAWMRAADGFVQTSLWEGLPMAILEASACALPVVATDVPGTGEAVVNGSTGWLCGAGNPDSIAEAMRRAMHATPEERATIGQAGRAFVVERYGIEAVLDQWEQLYTSLLVRRREIRTAADSRPG